MAQYPDHIYNHPEFQRALGFMHATHLSVVNPEKDWQLHGKYGQKRKYSLEAYSIHPHMVASGLARFVPDDLNLIIAGLLHDTVEDVPWVTPLILVDQFNHDVAALVDEVTDHPIPGSNRKQRDEAHIAKLAKGISARAQSLKLRDNYVNIVDMLEDDPDYGRIYARKKAEGLPYLKQGHPALYDAVEKLIQAVEKT